MKIISYLKALSDETRLRIVNILFHYELNVNEIVALLEMGQSRISRHLKILSDGGLLKSRRDGLLIFYSVVVDGDGREFLDALKFFIDNEGYLKKDLKNHEKNLHKRYLKQKQYFNSIASTWDQIKADIFGDFDISSIILPKIKVSDVVADLGCGNGYLLSEIFKESENSHLIGIDDSEMMLLEAEEKFKSFKNKPDLRIGKLEHLPMRDNEIDFAVMNMVLHYLTRPEDAVKEAERTIKSGGNLLIIDFEKHSDENMRTKFDHRWLGFSDTEMKSWIKETDFKLKEIGKFNLKNNHKLKIFLAEKE